MKNKMTAREYAKAVGHKVVGKLTRMPNRPYGMDNKHSYPWWIDDAGNEYLIDIKANQFYIVTKNGVVI